MFDVENAVEARREAKAARRPRQPFQGPSDGRRWLALARGDGWLVEAIAAHEGVPVAAVDAAIRAELAAEAADRAASESRPSRAHSPSRRATESNGATVPAAPGLPKAPPLPDRSPALPRAGHRPMRAPGPSWPHQPSHASMVAARRPAGRCLPAGPFPSPDLLTL